MAPTCNNAPSVRYVIPCRHSPVSASQCRDPLKEKPSSRPATTRRPPAPGAPLHPARQRQRVMARRRSPPGGAEAPTPPGRSSRVRDSGRATPYDARQRGGQGTPEGTRSPPRMPGPRRGRGCRGLGAAKPLPPAAAPRRRPGPDAGPKPPANERPKGKDENPRPPQALPGDGRGTRRLGGPPHCGSDPSKSLGKGVGEREGARENRFAKRFPSPPRIQNVFFNNFFSYRD